LYGRTSLPFRLDRTALRGFCMIRLGRKADGDFTARVADVDRILS
jgi:hypothetical protein